jgi:hypothetical protein
MLMAVCRNDKSQTEPPSTNGGISVEQRIAALLVVFFIGFVFGRLHNDWIMNRESRVDRLKLHKEIATERKLLRPTIEDEILIELGLGGCATVSEAAGVIERLCAGKPLQYPPPYPSSLKPAR